MQEKIIEILSSATEWMMANKIADIGGWRSAANVGVALAQMEKANGSVVRRKSPTERMHNGMPATEWKLAEKDFSAAAPEAKKKAKPMMEEIAIPVVRKDRTTESADANGVIIEGLNAQVDSLADKLALAEKQRDSHFAEAEDLRSQLDQAENANAAWLALAAEFGCHSIPELRYWIGKLTTAEAEEQAQPKPAGDLPLPAGYLVAAPNKPLRKFSKERNAMTAAAAAARQSGQAEIYAIHPHMKAVRGVEFKEAA